MDTVDTGARFESLTDEQRRLAQEADARGSARVARLRSLTWEGLADVDAGRVADDESMRAWADSLGTDHELPLPLPG